MLVEAPFRPAFLAAPFLVEPLREARDFFADFLVAFVVAFLALVAFLAADFLAAFFPVDLLVFLAATTFTPSWVEGLDEATLPQMEKRCLLWTMLQRCCQSKIRTSF